MLGTKPNCVVVRKPLVVYGLVDIVHRERRLLSVSLLASGIYSLPRLATEVALA
jgi:hypothetical protein